VEKKKRRKKNFLRVFTSSGKKGSNRMKKQALSVTPRCVIENSVENFG
jgi:hypothetical protein